MMQFSSSSRINHSVAQSQNNPIMNFSTSYRNFKIRDNVEKQRVFAANPPIINQIIRDDKPKTMTWGQPTWFLLHTIAQKVKDDQFPKIRRELFDIILKICNNLPCPDCATHATRYMQGINFDTIVTKQHLKDLLFRFHNSVNARKGYPLFEFKELDAKYSSANTVNIMQNFMLHFENRSYSSRVSAHNFHRGLAITKIKKWLFENSRHFN